VCFDGRGYADSGSLQNHVLIEDDHPIVRKVNQLIASGELTLQEQRALGCMQSMAVGDALGAPLEFKVRRSDSRCFSMLHSTASPLYVTLRFDALDLPN
jgi:hypothetical protein